jgi:hypothetical protein
MIGICCAVFYSICVYISFDGNISEYLRVFQDEAITNMPVLDLLLSTRPPLPVANKRTQAAVVAAAVPYANVNTTSEEEQHSKKRRLELVHATKTGGTAMELSAKKTGVLWGHEYYKKRGRKGYNITTPPSVTSQRYHGELWHTPPHWMSPNILKDADTFIVVRNPYSRYVSEYFCPWYPWTAHSTRDTRPDDADTMNQWIQTTIDSNRNKEQHAHMLPFHYFIWDERQPQKDYATNGKRQIRHILKYEEDLQERFHMLMKEYGLHNITLMGKSKESHSHAHNTTILDLSNESIQIINDYARKDFELLGYPMVSTAAELVEQ